MTTYIFEGAEVKLTGRVAVKRVTTVPGKPPRELKIVEITPVDDTFDWKKWVALDQMFEVIEKES